MSSLLAQFVASRPAEGGARAPAASRAADLSDLRDRTRPVGRGSGKVRRADLLMATSQLAIMCQSGVDLAEALRGVAEECRSPALKARLDAVYQAVRGGAAASVAMRAHVDVFGTAYVASIAAGEASGTVVDSLQQLTGLLKNELRLQKNLTSVMAYPAVLLAVTGCVLAALVFFVLPQFSKVFTTLGRPAPPLTQLLLDGATLLREQVAWVMGGVVLILVVLQQWSKTAAAQGMWDRFVLDAPLLRTAARTLLAGRAFRLMGTVLQSGVPLLEAVQLCRTAVKNGRFQRMFADLEQDVLNGKGIGGVLLRTDFIPPGAAQMVSTAERTGRLGEVLHTVGAFYEEEGESHVRALVKLLEPAVIVVMGGVVATVVLSIMLPLLDVSTVSR